MQPGAKQKPIILLATPFPCQPLKQMLLGEQNCRIANLKTTPCTPYWAEHSRHFLNIYGLFGCLKKKEEQSRGRESNSITLFESFLRNEREGFGGVSTTSNPSFLIPQNWRDLGGE